MMKSILRMMRLMPTKLRMMRVMMNKMKISQGKGKMKLMKKWDS